MAWSCIDLEFSRLLGPARTMAGCGGQCVGHDVDGLHTTTVERMNEFRSCMIKAWLSLCCFPVRQHVVWEHVVWHVPPARHILFTTPGFYLFGDVTWCTRAFTAAPVALVGLSYGIEERDIWSELMAQIHVCKTCFVFLAREEGKQKMLWCGWVSVMNMVDFLIMGRLRVRKVCQWLMMEVWKQTYVPTFREGVIRIGFYVLYFVDFLALWQSSSEL